jgi:ABC-type transport system involved in cytochrome c biogenesis permease component
MTFLPIVGRELAVAARRAGTYWLRFWAAAGALGVFFILRLGRANPATIPPGRDIFNALGVATLVFSMLAGVFLTADSLSCEKREGTLGLLFLTDLKGYDVVLGKLAAHSLRAFFGLLAVLPVFALPLLMGGTSGGELWRMALALTVTLIYSLSVGIVVSSSCTDARRAITGTLLWMLVSGGILPALWWLAPKLFSARQLAGFPRLDFLLWPSPVYAYVNGFDASYVSRFGAEGYWRSLTVIAFMAAAAIVAASLILPRSWRRSSAGERESKAARRGFFSRFQKSRRQPGMLDGNPFYWLALGGCASQGAMNGVFLIFLPLWVIFMFVSLDGSKSHAPVLVCFFVAIGLHVTAKLLVAVESARRFSQDRQSGALELLLATPLRVQAILDGQRQALATHFKGALWVLCLVNVALAGWVLGFPGPLEMDPEDQGIFIELFAGGFLVLLLDFRALVWAGMWNGLSARNHPRAALRTVGQVMLIPWVMMFLLIFMERHVNGAGEAALIFALWFGAGIVVDVVVIARAKGRLADRFRSAVAGSYRR